MIEILETSDYLAKMTCIYCRRKEPDTTFSQREHIILRTLGGLNRLPSGYVCDLCNNFFSPLEKRFVYNSHISIYKQLEGPSGRSGPFQTNLHFLFDNNQDKFIGTIEQDGIPKIADQIIICNDKIKFLTDGENHASCHDKFHEIISMIKEDSKIFILYDEQVLSKEYYLSFYKGKLIAFINSEEDKEHFITFINSIKEDDTKINYVKDSMGSIQSQVSSHQNIVVNIVDFNRIICKMVFNAIAFYHGINSIMHPNFDNMRDFILHGKGSFDFVGITGKSANTGNNQSFRDSIGELKIPPKSHVLICGDIDSEKNIVGILSLYDGNLEYSIRNDKAISILNSKKIHIVEYMNKKEYEYFEKHIQQIKKERGKEEIKE